MEKAEIVINKELDNTDFQTYCKCAERRIEIFISYRKICDYCN